MIDVVFHSQSFFRYQPSRNGAAFQRLTLKGVAPKMNSNSTPQQVLSRPQSVLVVEDELLLRAMLSEILREVGYSVIEACNGDDAWKIVLEKCPDLIVTDVRMPGAIDGIQLMENVRKTNLSLPIIITSAHLVHVEDTSHGPTHFLAKPYGFDDLVELIKLELHS